MHANKRSEKQNRPQPPAHAWTRSSSLPAAALRWRSLFAKISQKHGPRSLTDWRARFQIFREGSKFSRSGPSSSRCQVCVRHTPFLSVFFFFKFVCLTLQMVLESTYASLIADNRVEVTSRDPSHEVGQANCMQHSSSP